MPGSLILGLKGMRIMMFQLSGFYCTSADQEAVVERAAAQVRVKLRVVEQDLFTTHPSGATC